MPYEMLNNIIDIYKYIYVMDVYNREAFSNLHKEFSKHFQVTPKDYRNKYNKKETEAI